MKKFCKYCGGEFIPEYPRQVQCDRCGMQSSKKNIRKYMKNITTICLDCGRLYDRKHKGVFGVWYDTCDVCGKENVACADAAHDFGIYSSQEIALKDKGDDTI